MSRAEQLLPEGWKPKVGTTATLLETRDDPAPPHGRWKAVSAAPGAGMWWLLPVDDAAREWLAVHLDQRHPGGCITRAGRQLVPVGFRKPRPRDLSPAALQRVAGGAA